MSTRVASQTARHCAGCGRRLVHFPNERYSHFERRLTCSDACALFVVLGEGQNGRWHKLFPGATHRTWATVPPCCPRCQGPWLRTETGAGCILCGREVVVAATLGRHLLGLQTGV